VTVCVCPQFHLFLDPFTSPLVLFSAHSLRHTMPAFNECTSSSGTLFTHIQSALTEVADVT